MRYPNQLERWKYDEAKHRQLAAEAACRGDRRSMELHSAEANLALMKRKYSSD